MQKTLSLSVFDFKSMGSPCEFRLYAGNVKIAAEAFRAAAIEINRLEEKFSRYIPGNYLDRVNSAAEQGQAISIDEEFSSLLDFADTCYRQSDGLFDITSGVLRKAWDFSCARKPEQGRIDRIMMSVGWQHVERNGSQIRFLRKGMQLDLGGIVKEYAVDRAVALCRDYGIRHGLIDMGGDIHAIGPHPDGRPWVISIRHPRNKNGSFATILLSHGALASSGDYERCFEIDGKRYSHILSPVTGWPVSCLAAVSVVAPQCVLAGSACTIAMLKESGGIAWLDELGIDYVAMDINGNTYQSGSQRMAGIEMPASTITG